MLADLRYGTLCGVLALVGWASLAVSVEGSEPFHGWGQGYGPYCNPYSADFSGLYRVGRIPTPPYFSLHPPVYYSYPVARPYGYSPYAYPPYVMTPEPALPAPKVIQNQFVPKKTSTEVKKERVAAAPRRISNPFVVGSGNGDAGKLAMESAAGPQVIHPAATVR
jgi:hypothetical protein